MADRETTSEIVSKNNGLVSKFDKVFEKHFRDQSLVLKGQEGYEYPAFRALGDTFEELRSYKMTNMEIRKLVDYMTKDARYNDIFNDWLRVHTESWELELWPRNTYRIYVVGKNNLLRQEGKKRNLG